MDAAGFTPGSSATVTEVDGAGGVLLAAPATELSLSPEAAQSLWIDVERS